MQDQNFFPHVISFEHKEIKKEVKTPIQEIAAAVHTIAMKGLVSKDGKLLIDPGGMVVEHPSVGVYKVIHNLGYTNTSINVSIMEAPGSLLLKEHHPSYFVVEAYLDGALTDMDWCFTLMRTI